jgi:NAD(P)-dependent dehydrogenase (short-subunit alcohol dehydrogenase family)
MHEHVTALINGANRGLGRQFVAQLVARDAKVYAAARRPETIDLPRFRQIQIDITDPESVRCAAEIAGDITLLVNNAGISTHASLLYGTDEDVLLEMQTHFFGTLDVTRTFVPVIERNGGGAILNVRSVLSWLHLPTVGAYSAAKAVAWAMTNALRQELASRGIHMAALHVGYMDTDMTSYIPAVQRSILLSWRHWPWMVCSTANRKSSPTTFRGGPKHSCPQLSASADRLRSSVGNSSAPSPTISSNASGASKHHKPHLAADQWLQLLA